MIFTESSNAHPSFIPDEMKPRILCFGDSMTWGSDLAIRGHRLPGRWPRVLQATLGPGGNPREKQQRQYHHCQPFHKHFTPESLF